MRQQAVRHSLPLLAVLLLLGCMPDRSEVDPELARAAGPLLSDAEAGITLPRSNQPAPYAAMVATRFENERFRLEGNAQQHRLTLLNARQSLYPQLRPGADISRSGDVSIGANLDQVIYGGNTYQARLFSGDAEVIMAQLEILSRVNQDAARDLATLFSYHENRETARLLSNLSARISDLLDMAQLRATGGVAASSEVTLFELTLAEIETQARIAASSAQADRASLSAQPAEIFSQGLPSLTPLQGQVPLPVLEALAERDLRRAGLEVESSNRRPQVFLAGRGGVDPQSGDVTTDIGLNIRTNSALVFGGNTQMRLAEEALERAELDLADVIAETQREEARLRRQISLLQSQLAQTRALTAQAEDRFEAFESLFQAGSAGLTEAVSLVDTVQQSLESEVRLRFEVLRAELELAVLTGALVLG